MQDPDKAVAEDPDFDVEEAQHRLNEVYEKMSAISGSSAESRASKILHGLGFTVAMQRRSTQSFRCDRVCGKGVGSCAESERWRRYGALTVNRVKGRGQERLG